MQMMEKLTPRQDEMITKFLKVFSKYGLDNVSTKKLSEECGINEALFYRYFENKDDIVLKCVIKKRLEILQKTQQIIKNEYKNGVEVVCREVADYMEMERGAERFILQVMTSHKYEYAIEDIHAHIDKVLHDQGKLLSNKTGISEEMGYLIISIVNGIMGVYFVTGNKELLLKQFSVMLNHRMFAET